MKKIFYFFIFLFFLINLNRVIAIGFSPGVLEYNMDLGKQVCKTISVTSESSLIIISDQWAKNKTIAWKTSLFKKTAEYQGLSVIYPNRTSSNEEVNVCISGKYPGEYHGIILIREEQVENTIMQGGVWVKVIINGDPSIKNPNLDKLDTEKQPEELLPDIQTNSPVTGAVIGTLGTNLWITVIIFLLIIVIIYMAILIHKKSKKFGEFNI